MILSARKRLLALVAACLMLLGSCAAMAEQALVTKSAAVYASAKTSAKKLGTLSAGTQLELVAEKNGWAMVRMNGNTGYMKSSALAEYKTYDNKAAYTVKSTVMYKTFSTSSKKLGTIPSGSEVTVSATAGKWARVSYRGYTGFVALGNLTTKAPAKEEASKSITAYASVDNAVVYNVKGKVIGKVAINTQVTVTAEKNGICQVKRGDVTAYMKKNQLSASKVEVKQEDDGVTEIDPTTFYVKNDSATVVDASGEAIAKLSVNTAVTVTAYTDKYAKVTNGSSVGFMLKYDLSTEKVATSYSLSYGDKGEAVEKVQKRLKELGFFAGTVGGNYLDLTKAAVTAFQAAAGLTTTGVCDEKTLALMASDKAPKKEVAKEETSESETGNSTVKAATGTAKTMDWWTSGIQSIFSRGSVATVTDVATGIAWREKRSGGTNHADVQPLTAADTAAMKKAVGSWSWTRRAVFVTIDGVNYAASMNCMPHGSGSITNNNFNGHHCIHFTNSRTHGSNRVCSLHQAAIKKAASTTL